MRSILRMPNSSEVQVFDWRDVPFEAPIDQPFTASAFRSGCFEVLVVGCSARTDDEFALKRGMEGSLRLYVGEHLECEVPLRDLHGQTWRHAYARLREDVRHLFTRLGVELPSPPKEQVDVPEIAGGLLLDKELPRRIREELLQQAVVNLAERALEDPQWSTFAIPLYLRADGTMRLQLVDVPDWCHPRITLHGIGKFAAA